VLPGWVIVMPRISSDLRLTIAAVVTGVLNNVSGYLVPFLEQGAVSRFHLTATQAAWVPTSENLTAGLISVLLARQSRFVSLRRLATIALMVWVPVFLVTHLAPNMSSLLVLRVLAGAAAGLLIYVSTTAAAATARPDRTFGLIMLAANAFVGLIMTTLNRVWPGATPLCAYPYAAILALPIIPLVVWLPRYRDARSARSSSSETTSAPSGGPLLALIFTANLVAMVCVPTFAFSIPMGLRLGMSELDVDTALGTATFLGSVGALAVSVLPRRAGHLWPAMIALIATAVSNYLTVVTHLPPVFRICLITNQVLGYFLVPVLLGWSAQLDPSGRSATLMNGTSLVTIALCPTLAAVLVDHLSLAGLSGEVLLVSASALACIVWLGSRGRGLANDRPAPLSAVAQAPKEPLNRGT
jgi:predicted MFS family arabinose efflux permease